MLLNGMIKALPNFVGEYSTAIDFDRVTRLAINCVATAVPLSSLLIALGVIEQEEAGEKALPTG